MRKEAWASGKAGGGGLPEKAQCEPDSPEKEEGQGSLYLLLARVFSSPPDADVVRVWEALGLKPRGEDEGELGTAVALLGAALNEDTCWALIEEDYRRLFLGPGRLPAPPWESVYRSPQRLVFQEQTLEVRRAYLLAGFSHQGMFAEPDDHIALELEFLGLLCQQRAEALRARDLPCAEDRLRHRANFLREHLCSWAEAFTKDIETGASTPFWRAIALLLCALAEYDAERTSAHKGAA